MCEVLRKNAVSCKTCNWYAEGLCIGNCELAEDNQTVCETLYNAGYCKSTDVAEEIFAEIEKWLAKGGDIMIITAEKFAELKKKYTQGIDSIVGIEWHCEEGWKPTDTLKFSGDEKFVDENGEEHGYSKWYKESEDTE